MPLAALGALSPHAPGLLLVIAANLWMIGAGRSRPCRAGSALPPCRGRADPQQTAQPPPWVTREDGLRSLAASSCAGEAKVSAEAPTIQPPSKGRILSR